MTQSDTSAKEPKIGKYKTKRTFNNFVTGLKGKTRLLRKEAFLKGETLSGMIEGVIFKISICDEGTIDFQEVDTQICNESMIKRFIDEICNMDVTGYVEKYIVGGLEFQDEEGVKCYLEVDYKKPIDQLFSIFEDKNSHNISNVGLSLLDSLLADVSVEEHKESVEDENTQTVNVFAKKKDPKKDDYLQEQFSKMNQEKIEELKSRIEKSEKESTKIKSEISRSQQNLDKLHEDLKVLESRLDSLKTYDEPNGFVFWVSDLKKPEGLTLTEENKAIADKIADIIGLKKDVLFKMLTEGHYIIKIAPKDDQESESVKLTTEVYQKVISLSSYENSKDAKISSTTPGTFEYRGESTWHQLVQRMIRKGFIQDDNFDKLCGSNSYDSVEDVENQEVK